MATRRLSLGHTVTKGDLVIADGADSVITAPNDNGSVKVVESDSEALQYSLQDVVLPMIGVMHDADGDPQPCAYPTLDGVSREAHDAYLLTEFGLSADNFEKAAGSAAVFHGLYRPVWASCNTLQCHVVPAPGPEDTTPVLVTDNMVMERASFELRVTPIVTHDALIEKHPEYIERNLLASQTAADFPHGMHVILSAVLPCSAYPSMLLRELATDVAWHTSPVAESVL
eukprot:TRINITY_DN49389_c0_g1_i1.p1 TRINITY_DN49389_c0_g1~~TRINITY_DN49389_c0_g1_i1.p1  ORF type:complete len:242 (+),score=98.24 TRINITY_DN49389_c0_g1_i1:45-728(+)